MIHYSINPAQPTKRYIKYQSWCLPTRSASLAANIANLPALLRRPRY